jgi:hypothetical protein
MELEDAYSYYHGLKSKRENVRTMTINTILFFAQEDEITELLGFWAFYIFWYSRE